MESCIRIFIHSMSLSAMGQPPGTRQLFSKAPPASANFKVSATVTYLGQAKASAQPYSITNTARAAPKVTRDNMADRLEYGRENDNGHVETPLEGSSMGRLRYLRTRRAGNIQATAAASTTSDSTRFRFIARIRPILSSWFGPHRQYNKEECFFPIPRSPFL